MTKEDYQEQLSYKSMEMIIKEIMHKLEYGKTIDNIDKNFIKRTIEEAEKNLNGIKDEKNIQKWVKLSGR